MSADIKYKGASFYKCALQVNPASYAKFSGNISRNEQEYNQQILEQCQTNKIKVVGLADHGQVEKSESLRKILRENSITVFPGFEIASSEKIHMVCLYKEDSTVAVLNQNIGQLMGSNSSQLQTNPTHPSSLSCEQIAKKILHDQQGFWFAAHMTGNKGLLRLSGVGDNYAHLWIKDDLVIAGQIPGSIDDLNVESRDLAKYSKIIANKNPDYKRKKLIAIINAKDIAIPEDLAQPSASCLIKMTTPNFASFTKAFLDSESRIRLNHQLPDRPYSYIKSIEWKGAGFFENNSIAFSKNLNAVIGGRGTGKSTLIESIRYVLDLTTRNKDINPLEAHRKRTLNNSQIILTIHSKAQQGQCYSISRRYGEQAIVKNEEGNISNLSPNDILPNIELLGQNEILEIEKDNNAQLALVNNFLPDGFSFDEKITDIKHKLKNNRDSLIRASEEFEQLDVAVSQEPMLKEKNQQFKQLGIEAKLKNARFLEGEKNIKKRINEQFDLVENWITDYKDIFDLIFLQDAYIEKLPNKVNIVKTRQIFEHLQKTLDDFIKQVSSSLQKAKNDYQQVQTIWQQASNKIQDELSRAVAQLPEQAGKTGKELGAEYSNIIKQLTSIEQQKNSHKNQQKLINIIKQERDKLLEEYRNTAFERFNAINKAVTQLNKGSLKNKVKINVMSCGNLENLKKFLLQISGIGESKIEWLDLNNIKPDLVQWSQWIANKDVEAFIGEYREIGLTKGFVDKLLGIGLEKQLMLQEIELKDKIKIELNTAHTNTEAHYEPLTNLSTGQKCTAILNLLLLSRDDPLIIDQPEDNLDNAFIAERIVQDLRQFKTNRQFLFATHNANIPVFGDAELIAVLDKKGIVKDIGSIDKREVGSQAAEILEGGEAAFNMRKNKYGF